MNICIIGCGNMGSGIAKRLSKSYALSLYDLNEERCSELAKALHVKAFNNLHEAIETCEVVILAVKPQNLSSIANLIKKDVKSKQLLISILAGTPYVTLRANFDQVPLLRMMPNLAVVYGQGVIGLAENPELSKELKQNIEKMCSLLGYSYWMSEDKMDALSSLTGCGPAFVFVLIEAMVEASMMMGFNAAQGKEFVLQMLTGALTIMRETDKHPAVLKWQVASPGGMTLAGLQKMEEEGVRSGIMRTFLAAHQKGKQMAQEQ